MIEEKNLSHSEKIQFNLFSTKKKRANCNNWKDSRIRMKGYNELTNSNERFGVGNFHGKDGNEVTQTLK